MRLHIMIILLYLSVAASTALGDVNVQPNSDGTLYTAVQVNGASTLRYDIVFIGDGFTVTEQDAFNMKVNEAVAALQAMVPYSQRLCAFNIWRVNVVSAQSGVDHPVGGIFKNTELDCRYGNPTVGEAERCITSDSPAKCFEAADYAPDYDVVFVLVNDTQWGGCAGSLVFSSIAPGFFGIITHELGHKIGLLADEYDCYVCDGSDNNRTYADVEPSVTNLTKQTTRALVKWTDLIAPTTPLPTTVDDPPGVVGIWEGGGYYRFNSYRPQLTCHMRTTGSPFCAVCEKEMRRMLETYCTFCENNPSNFICWFLANRGKLTLIWDRPYKWRWPWPPCLTCPPFTIEDEIIYVLKGVPEGFKLQILDERGAIIAEGRPTEQGLEVSFKENRFKQYFVELTSREKATGETLNITAQLFRNNKLENLP